MLAALPGWGVRRAALAALTPPGHAQRRLPRSTPALRIIDCRPRLARPMPAAAHTPASLSTARGAPGAAGSQAERAASGDPQREARDRQLGAWLTAAAAGDASAFEAFYEATFALARTVARRLLRDNAEVEDLLADCYVEAWQKAGRFDAERGSPVTWLLTLVRSRGLDALRAAAARPERAAGSAAAGDIAPAEESAANQPDAAAADADPAEQLWRRQAGAELHAALAALSAAERWVLGLAYMRELSHTEIASCTGMPLGTVKSHALRAQNKLRSLLGPGLAPAAAQGAWASRP
jgi:RNA polymerase sigma-70 factor (ECF subfamily)